MTTGRQVPGTATDAGAARKLSGPARGELTLAPGLLEIVCMLANGGERSCGAFGLPIAKSTLTHHLKVLREAGVIEQRPEGTSRITYLRRKDLDARFPGLLDSVLVAARKRRGRRRPQPLL